MRSEVKPCDSVFIYMYVTKRFPTLSRLEGRCGWLPIPVLPIGRPATIGLQLTMVSPTTVSGSTGMALAGVVGGSALNTGTSYK